MKKYRVPVIVTTTKRGWIEVDAPDQNEAETTAEIFGIDLVQEPELTWWNVRVDDNRETTIVQDEEIER